jgi:hypothetical protein
MSDRTEAQAPERPPPFSIDTRWSFWALAGWAVFVAAGLAGIAAYLGLFRSGVPLLPASRIYPAPGLTIDPNAELASYLAEQNRLLGTGGAPDPDTGRPRIPIEQAMAEIVRRGAHAFDPLDASAPDSARDRAVKAATKGHGGGP